MREYRMPKGKRFPNWNRLAKEAVFFALIQFMVSSPAVSGARKPHGALKKQAVASARIDRAALLKNSQISYRAEGGFTGIRSYGVLISCVDGKVSVLKSIYDPRLGRDRSRVRHIEKLDRDDYLSLWRSLEKQAVFKAQNAPQPKGDILDEFTLTFSLKVRDSQHRFLVYGISRPEAARYFAFRNLIDTTVNMGALWRAHQTLLARK